MVFCNISMFFCIVFWLCNKFSCNSSNLLTSCSIGSNIGVCCWEFVVGSMVVIVIDFVAVFGVTVDIGISVCIF